ncbi:hypothetical protein DOTSEDRAFT_70031 [Dothistroma septosporum NZE10]|uniref:Serine-rich protein n=1 Tax=Dothistroma septosporum (strain NZE10 / CBS 128990) TaxID=675120 RepID=N1Q0X7_DOTSN|nr:hypothetical protein DOTSEDRAFT_70031 [Dothistroma septosporum NZE10]
MFLDPEPVSKRKKDMSSGFFSSQRPVTSSRNHPARTSWRKASVHERTKSENNRQEPNLTVTERPATVRLVNPSPSPESPTTRHGEGSDDANKEECEEKPTALPRAPRSAQFREASVLYPATSATNREYNVSETDTLANEPQDSDNAPGITLLSDGWQHELPRPVWHRRNTSSGYDSQASTLQESEIAYSKKSRKSERYSSLSQLSTLRGTPTPHEQETRERAEGDAAARSGPAQALQTLQENSPERPERLSTIRPVPASDTSSLTDPGPGARSPESSPVRPQTAPSDLEQPSSNEGTPQQSFERPLSADSTQPYSSTPNWRDVTAAPASQHRRDGSPESPAISEATFPSTSSPNFIAYTPDSIRPISKKNPIHGATSIESINSRLKSGPIGRPDTGRSLSNSASRASLTSSNDTLPPLYIPKKRLRHKVASESLSLQAEAQAQDEAHAYEAMDDIDTLPFPKRPFSSHLSTIASESEQSRTASQHLSHFSLGSGILTGDDASSLPLSPGHRRQWSAPAESIASGPHSTRTRGTNSSEFQEDAGDMTLGMFRQESAMPEPLFKADTASGSKATDAPRRYDGPLPPLPPMPRGSDSDENFDTLSELQTPALHPKRSGRSLRARSNSTPSHSRQLSQISYVESERTSQGSALFPTWAKRFYSGTHALRSKTSFGSLSAQSRMPVRHQRGDSAFTDRSVTSRLGTGYSNVESSSPVSSHFLPAIFRPRNRKRSLDHQRNSRDSRSSKMRKSNSRRSRDRPSQDTRDSMAIHRDPLPQEDYEEGPKDSATDILPSGQPKWGRLKDPDSPPGDENGRGLRLPRKYSKQRQWDQMEFPRPMTKDRLSDFGVHDANATPHLAPSKRTSQNRLSAWHAPSFVSSLDTLITSRHNRQILLFVLGFICPLTWMLGAALPLPKKPLSAEDLEANLGTAGQSEEDVQMAMMKHEAGDAERRWREEKLYHKARWWRMLNRVMSVVGVGVIAAVIALAVITTS